MLSLDVISHSKQKREQMGQALINKNTILNKFYILPLHREITRYIIDKGFNTPIQTTML